VESSAVTGIFIAWTAEAPIGNSLDMRPTGTGRAAATISMQMTCRKRVRVSVTDASLRRGRLRGNNFWAKHRSREHKAQSSVALEVRPASLSKAQRRLQFRRAARRKLHLGLGRNREARFRGWQDDIDRRCHRRGRYSAEHQEFSLPVGSSMISRSMIDDLIATNEQTKSSDHRSSDHQFKRTRV
jgi:hypothetical protein